MWEIWKKYNRVAFIRKIYPEKCKSYGPICYAMFSSNVQLLFKARHFIAKQFAQALEMTKDQEEAFIATVVAVNKAA